MKFSKVLIIEKVEGLFIHLNQRLSPPSSLPGAYSHSYLLAFSMSLKLLAKYDDFHRGLGPVWASIGSITYR